MTGVSMKIRDLSLEDLNYLEKLLSNEWSKQLDQMPEDMSDSEKENWIATGQYPNLGPRIAQVRRIREAISSQKTMNTMAKW